jgi:hypothetical protein
MPAPGRCSGPAKLGAAATRDRASAVKAPRQRDGRAALPDARARASETDRQSESELVVEAPRLLERLETWRIRVADSNDAALFDGGSRRVRAIQPRLLAGEMLRVLSGWAVGVEPAANPVERITVNVGSARCAPSRGWRLGTARCRLMRCGRDGVRVVVVGVATHLGGRESRPQGEGGQQDRSAIRRLGGRA